MRRTLKIIQLLCGLAILYITFGGIVGAALTRHYAHEPACIPYVVTFGVFLWKCESAAADLFWSVVVGWPRVAIVPPALAFTLIKDSVKNHHWFFLHDAVWWMLWSVPLVLVAWGGFAYWKTRSTLFAIGLTATLVGEIVYLGMLE
jgi:hypothetical protein